MHRRHFLLGLSALALSRRAATAELTVNGAGHDAQSLAHIAPMGMIFIPSVDGISHSPKELTHPGDIEVGATVLLRSILAIDGLALA